MDADVERIRGLQSYIFDYVTGILWTITLLILLATQARLEAVVKAVLIPLSSVNIKIPDVVAGFLLIVGGVVLPYCVAVAFKPIVLRIMTAVNRLQKRLQRGSKKAAKKSERGVPEPKARSLNDRAIDIVGAKYGAAGEPPRHHLLAYVRHVAQAEGERLERKREEIWFRAAAVLPTALLFAAVTHRTLNGVIAISVSVTVGILMFWVGAWFVNRELVAWTDEVYAIVVLTAAPDQPVRPILLPSDLPSVDSSLVQKSVQL